MGSRSSPPSPPAPKSHGRSVSQQDVALQRVVRIVMTKPRRLFRIHPKKNAPSSPKEPANTCQNWSPKRNVSMFQKKFAQDPKLTRKRSRSQLSRSGATCPLKNLDLHKSKTDLQCICNNNLQ